MTENTSNEKGRVIRALMGALGAQRAVYYAVKDQKLVPQMVMGDPLPLSRIEPVSLPSDSGRIVNPVAQAYMASSRPGMENIFSSLDDIRTQGTEYHENNITYIDPEADPDKREYAKNCSVCYRTIRDADNHISGIMVFSTTDPSRQVRRNFGKDAAVPKPRVITKENKAFATELWNNFRNYITHPRPKATPLLSEDKHIELLKWLAKQLNDCLTEKTKTIPREKLNDPDETWEHSDYVAKSFRFFVKNISMEVFGKPPEKNLSKLLHLTALCHDIGKAALPLNQLHKEHYENGAGLTRPELFFVRRHVIDSMQMLHLPGIDPRLVDLAGEHHQGANGETGYPDGGGTQKDDVSEWIKEQERKNTEWWKIHNEKWKNKYGKPDLGWQEIRAQKASAPFMESQMLLICDTYDGIMQKRRGYRDPSRSTLSNALIEMQMDADRGIINPSLLSLFISDVLRPSYTHGEACISEVRLSDPTENNSNVELCNKALKNLPSREDAIAELRKQQDQFMLLNPERPKIGSKEAMNYWLHAVKPANGLGNTSQARL